MTQNRMTKIFNSNGGCEEDCKNCPYPDCYKPAREMKPLKDIADILRCDRLDCGESQQKMYTLELGKCGRCGPNINRKFYRRGEIMVTKEMCIVIAVIAFTLGSYVGLLISALLTANGRDDDE